MVFDEIFLIGKRILKFIDLHLKSIICMQTIFFRNLNVIIIGDFYQVVQNIGVIKSNMNNIDILTLNFWIEPSHVLKQ